MTHYATQVKETVPLINYPERCHHTTFQINGKKHVLLHSIHVPTCCGAKLFMCKTKLPDTLLDDICDTFAQCGELLIFIMPKLPSKVTVIAKGIGVIRKATSVRDRQTELSELCKKLTKSPYYVLPTPALPRPSSINYNIECLTHYSKDTYFVSGFNSPAKTLQNLSTVMNVLKNTPINLLAIAISSQREGMRFLKKNMTLVFKCTNYKTRNTLHVFYKGLGGNCAIAKPLKAIKRAKRDKKGRFISSTAKPKTQAKLKSL